MRKIASLINILTLSGNLTFFIGRKFLKPELFQ